MGHHTMSPALCEVTSLTAGATGASGTKSGISVFARGGGSHAGSISVSTEHAPDDAFHERDRVHMGCQ